MSDVGAGSFLGSGFRIHRLVAGLARHIPMMVLCVVALFPTYFMVTTSLKDNSEYLFNKVGLPHSPTLANFAEIFAKESFLVWVRNSIILTVGSVLVSMAVAALASYAFSRMEFRGKEILFNSTVSLMIVPTILMIVPLFVLMARVRLINTYPGTISIYVGTLLPFSIYLLTRFFETIPQELIDAASIDGCSGLQVLTRIVIPLSRPAFITLGVVNTFYVWNELLVALVFMQRDHLKTLMVGVTLFSTYRNMNVPLVMAGLVLSVLPVVTLYLVGQQYFIRGLTAGSLRD